MDEIDKFKFIPNCVNRSDITMLFILIGHKNVMNGQKKTKLIN